MYERLYYWFIHTVCNASDYEYNSTLNHVAFPCLVAVVTVLAALIITNAVSGIYNTMDRWGTRWITATGYVQERGYKIIDENRSVFYLFIREQGLIHIGEYFRFDVPMQVYLSPDYHLQSEIAFQYRVGRYSKKVVDKRLL